MHIFQFQNLLNEPLKVKIFLTNINLPIWHASRVLKYSNQHEHRTVHVGQWDMNLVGHTYKFRYPNMHFIFLEFKTRVTPWDKFKYCYGWRRKSMSELCVCIKRGPLGNIYNTQETHPKPQNRGKDYTTLDYYTLTAGSTKNCKNLKKLICYMYMISIIFCCLRYNKFDLNHFFVYRSDVPYIKFSHP